jgi:hypothetical protein
MLLAPDKPKYAARVASRSTTIAHVRPMSITSTLL